MEQQSSSSLSDHQTHWIQIQEELKKKLITEDNFTWEIPHSCSSSSVEMNAADDDKRGERKERLKYVGGVDISSFKEDPSLCCGTLVVLDLDDCNLDVVYADFSVSKLSVPYVPGFLAFREAPILLRLLEKMKKDAHPLYPQLLMVDGNGLLHPRGFGLACHLGVLADLPTIGVGKNLHHVEGLNHLEVRELLKAGDNKESVFLTGNSGRNLGVALKSTLGALKPIFVSVGHRISLTTALKIVKMTCKYRVPEPIRQADIRSREYLRKHVLEPPSS